MMASNLLPQKPYLRLFDTRAAGLRSRSSIGQSKTAGNECTGECHRAAEQQTAAHCSATAKQGRRLTSIRLGIGDAAHLATTRPIASKGKYSRSMTVASVAALGCESSCGIESSPVVQTACKGLLLHG
jgi:hypothetical protein